MHTAIRRPTHTRHTMGESLLSSTEPHRPAIGASLLRPTELTQATHDPLPSQASHGLFLYWDPLISWASHRWGFSIQLH